MGLTGPDGATVRAELDALLAKFKLDPAGAPVAIVARMAGKTLNDYGGGQIDFFDLWSGGSYLVDQSPRFRVLIASTPKTVVYKIGTAVTAATYSNAASLSMDCGTN